LRILVTGGAGFIGSHLVDRLCDDGHDVAVLDNLTTGKTANIEHRLDEVRFINGSILDAALVQDEIERVEAVFHLASAVGVKHILNAPLESMAVMTRGTENVLDACSRYWRPVLIASTSEVYGKSPKVPMSEDDDRVLGPTSLHRWSYSTAKALDEHLAFAHFDRGLPVVVVRYFNSYGPRIDPGGYGSVVAEFIRRAASGDPLPLVSGGRQTRCFTYVEDTVRGTIAALSTREAHGRVFNLGSTHETTIAELADTIRDLVGSSSAITEVTAEAYYGRGYDDTPRRVPDVSRARDVLGWAPEVSLDEGLRRTIEWWRKTYG